MNRKDVDAAFDESWLKINKELNIFIGIWPHKSEIDKFVRRVIVLFVLSGITLPHVLGISRQCGKSLSICGENIAGLCMCIGFISKYIVPIVSKKKFEILYRKIATNWTVIRDPVEKAILEEFSKLGRAKTLFYFVYTGFAGFTFCQMTALPAILDYIVPLNESRPKILVTKAEFPFDPFDYYYELYALYCAAAIVSVSVLTSTDTTYTVIIHQSLGIFGIVKRRLKQAAESKDEETSSKILISAIELHKQALEFLELIEQTYQVVFLTFIFVTIVFLSFGSLIIVEHSDELLDLIRMTILEIGAMIHVFFISWPGQLVIDHSEDLFLSTYTTKWYNMPIRNKKILLFMMMRCLEPSFLTAGGFYIMNFENFGSIVQTTLSYVTVALSFH